MTKRLTSKIVVDYHIYMARRFDFEIVRKADDELMILISRGLEVMGIMDDEEFMKRYAVSFVDPLLDRRFVWIPWEIGQGSQAALRMQCEVLAHEAGHIVRAVQMGPRWGPKYLLSKSFRGHEEAQAMRPQMEMHFYLTGKRSDTARLANGLKNYRVRSRDIRVMKIELDIIQASILRGRVGSLAGKNGIRYLKRKLR
jgi:hypothetical protein